MFWLQVILAGLLVVGSYVGLGVLTAMGQRRRGGGVLAVATAVLFFPVHWARGTRVTRGPSGAPRSEGDCRGKHLTVGLRVATLRPMRRSRILAAMGAFSTLVAVWGGAVTSPALAGAAPVQPSVDDFYRAPDGFESTAPGTILRGRPVQLASYSALPFNAQAWQLLYRTTDFAGNPMPGVTT
ncbi:hypothetical protein GS493_13455 [Rhodococcus hoagii]|nr:hypothetical protein [Prescottella equi]